jgi:hypothetical protein
LFTINFSPEEASCAEMEKAIIKKYKKENPLFIVQHPWLNIT